MAINTLNNLRSHCEDPEVRVVSVDVFDTLLLRDTMPESTRFKEIAELQSRAINEATNSDVSPLDFFLLRREAARTVYTTKKRVKNAREATWREIYDLVFLSLEIPASHHLFELCNQVELNYEKKRLTLNTKLNNLLVSAGLANKRVICLSDMYLPSDQIKYLIDCTIGHETSYEVYSSADYGYGKGCGALFHQMAAISGADLSEIVHCGDNRITDYEVPSSLGVRAIYMPRSGWWRMARSARSYWFQRSFPSL